MKNATAVRHVASVGNIDTSEAVAMTINADGMQVVMSMLSNMYSDPNLAILREYSCNARDSHVEAGQTRPIEITLPTMLEPQLLVRDYGVGLSRDGIINTYAQYGASTKRNSNDQIGAFGIGSKSAFTAGNQFTVTGIKDGEKTIAMFSLDRSGNPMVQILHHGSTDEGNGVTVEIGVEDWQAVVRASQKFFLGWRPGSVLVDGKQPHSWWSENTEEIAHGVYIDWDHQGTFNNNLRVMMGGVPYDIPTALWTQVSQQARLFQDSAYRSNVAYIFDLPIGSVDIAPNREDLRITPLTKSTITRVLELASNSMPGFISNKLDSAKNIWEAGRVFVQLNDALSLGMDSAKTYWKSQSLGNPQVILNHPTFMIRYGSSRYDYTTGQNKRSKTGKQYPSYIFDIDNDEARFNKVLIVTDVPEDKVNTVRLYAKPTILSSDNSYETIIASPDSFKIAGWFSYGTGESPIDTMTFAEFHKRGKEMRKAMGGTGRTKTEYATRMKGDGSWTQRTASDVSDLDASLILTAGPHFSLDLDNPVIKELWMKNDIVVVKLKATQKLEVFQKTVPEATTTANDWFTTEARKLLSTITQADKDLCRAYSQRHLLNRGVVKFIQRTRNKITNRVLVDEVERLEKANNFTDQDQKTIQKIKNIYQAANVGYPFEALGNELGLDGIVKDQLPLFWGALSADWAMRSALGSQTAYDNALIDYINRTPVTV